MNDNITKEVMEQYEAIRQMGPCNMFDLPCVQDVAERMDFLELADLDREDYIYIISNFSVLMKQFDVSQEKEEQP